MKNNELLNFKNNEINTNYTIIPDEEIQIGNCKINWSNGEAERNLNKLAEEIDSIISNNSMSPVQSVKHDGKPVTTNGKEGDLLDPEDGPDIKDTDVEFEQNINEDNVESEQSTSAERQTDRQE